MASEIKKMKEVTTTEAMNVLIYLILLKDSCAKHFTKRLI